MKIFTIFDMSADTFANPTFAPSVAAFERDVAMALKNPPAQPTAFHTYPDQFKLFYLGEFNSDTGVIVGFDFPQEIGRASDLLNSSPVASAA